MNSYQAFSLADTETDDHFELSKQCRFGYPEIEFAEPILILDVSFSSKGTPKRDGVLHYYMGRNSFFNSATKPSDEDKARLYTENRVKIIEDLLAVRRGENPTNLVGLTIVEKP